MSVRVVLFDVMDTVITDPFREALTAATTISLEELHARRDPDLWPAFERGELDEDGYWAGWRAAGIPFDRERFHTVRLAGMHFLPGMAELLDDLAGTVERVTASNYPVWVDDLALTHLAGRFERIVASCHLGVRKPEPVFFTRLLDTLGIGPADARFVDDRQANVDAAAEVGIASHHFAGASGLRRWLVDEGVTLPRD